MSEFATYEDVYGTGGMADDRDDSNDPEFRDLDGYCEHGTYVGGCGTDWMCHWCEDGISAAEAKRIVTAQWTRQVRETAMRAERLIGNLLRLGMSGTDAASLVQDAPSNYVVNPRSRYGRH
jgi:hypothetical protein